MQMSGTGRKQRREVTAWEAKFILNENPGYTHQSQCKDWWRNPKSD